MLQNDNYIVSRFVYDINTSLGMASFSETIPL